MVVPETPTSSPTSPAIRRPWAPLRSMRPSVVPAPRLRLPWRPLAFARAHRRSDAPSRLTLPAVVRELLTALLLRRRAGRPDARRRRPGRAGDAAHAQQRAVLVGRGRALGRPAAGARRDGPAADGPHRPRRRDGRARRAAR